MVFRADDVSMAAQARQQGARLLLAYNKGGSGLDDRWFRCGVSHNAAAGLEENPDSTERDAG